MSIGTARFRPLMIQIGLRIERLDDERAESVDRRIDVESQGRKRYAEGNSVPPLQNQEKIRLVRGT